jgi:predicted phosphodiesterase
MNKAPFALIVGDTHGNARWLYERVIPHAVRTGCKKIVQLGDFGFIFPTSNFPYALDKMSRVLDREDIDLHFLPGNHEDHDKLERMLNYVKVRSPEGHYQIRKRLFYTGRMSAWSWEGKRFAAVGGAVSIDKEYRLRHKARTGTTIWWPQEVLTQVEVQEASQLGLVDVLFTHDAPVQNPFKLKQDIESHIHRQKISSVAFALQPKLWFHGHYHESATYQFRHPGGFCRVVSLGRDGSPMGESTTVFHLSAEDSHV